MKTSRKGSTTAQERQHDVIKLIQAYAAPRCHHLKTNGLRCKSPALRQGKYCFFHNNLRTAPREIVVPALEDADAVQLVVQQVVRAVLNGLLESKTAGVALYGLQLASANLKNTTFEPHGRDGCTDPATLATLYDPSGSGAEPEYDYDDDDEDEEEADDDEASDEDDADDKDDDSDGEQEDSSTACAADEASDDAGDNHPASAPEVDPRLQPGDTAAPLAAASAAEVATPQPPDSTPNPAPLSILRACIEQSIAELPAAAPEDPPALSRKAIRKYQRLLKSLNASASSPATRHPQLRGQL